MSFSSQLRRRPFVVARLRALSAARLAFTVFLSGCGGEAAMLDAWPPSRGVDDRLTTAGAPGDKPRLIAP